MHCYTEPLRWSQDTALASTSGGCTESGFLGALFVCSVAQLMTQVTASLFPASFINNSVIIWILRFMLLIEASGVVNACWPLSWAMSRLGGLEPDPIDNLDAEVLDRKRSMGLGFDDESAVRSGEPVF